MNDEQKRMLLGVARRAMAASLIGKKYPKPSEPDVPEAQDAGAFVSLHNDARLRGCIGTFHASGPIVETVNRMAVQTLGDPRFLGDPVTAAELSDLDVEISVLSPLRETDDPLSLEIGKHGIYITSGDQSGCFLPQVATRLGWNAEKFLTECCRGKAGLPPDAWRDPETTVRLFTAEVFSEHELGRA